MPHRYPDHHSPSAQLDQRLANIVTQFFFGMRITASAAAAVPLLVFVHGDPAYTRCPIGIAEYEGGKQ
jgi:hypothetical protein